MIYHFAVVLCMMVVMETLKKEGRGFLTMHLSWSRTEPTSCTIHD